MTSTKKIIDNKKELSELIKDPSTGKVYLRGKFLGKGGFARCYELTESITREVYAGKIVSKTLLVKQHQKEKMSQEISIHRSLKHQHIVGFHSYFEDTENVYIILEICRRRSLMELHKRRKAVTEPETRYFLRHILLGVKHLHDRSVIHRDLKLGNLFINEAMDVKIGDFGLATKVGFEGERKRTLCGTPNYIAPEILSKKGHSYEVDIWSIGCILYTLLVGKPPFETQTLKDTYMRIKRNEYQIPNHVRPMARSLIQKLLQDDPTKRPSVDIILHDDFMTQGYLPSRLPTSCLTMAPRFDAPLNASIMTRKPLIDINNKDGSPMKAGAKEKMYPGISDQNADMKARAVAGKGAKEIADHHAELEAATRMKPNEPEDCYIKDLYNQVDQLVKSKPNCLEIINEDEAEDPAAVPMIWIAKWVDYSDKYGLGYHLSDDSIGVLFNDFTKLLLLQDGENIHYIERNGEEHYHCLQDYPKTLEKKMTLLKYFRNYMNEHLLKAGAAMAPREGDELARIPVLKTYFRTRSAIVMHLTNGTLQINFFEDHTKIICCPLMGAITYIDKQRNFRTYRMEKIKEHGCSSDLFERLIYAKNMIQKLMVMKSSSAKMSGSSKSIATQQQHQQPIRQ